MRIYLDIVMLLNFLIDLLLLLAANRLAGYPQNLRKCLLGAAVGGVYGGVCLLPRFYFLGNTIWRLVFLGLIGVIVFGYHRSSIRRLVLFVLLCMALGGIVQALGDGSILSLLLGALAVSGMCVVGFRGTAVQQEFVEVELSRGEKHTTLLALRDTGNTLRDPVTGQSVLVADAETAEILLGLTRKQLRSPVETVAAGRIPGLRLIPYRAVGESAGMLVAIRLEQVRIGNWRGSTLVAFAPDGLGEDNTYRALTGGIA